MEPPYLMSESPRTSIFEGKVAELLALTAGLSVTQILVLRRMTLADPATAAWASERELGVVFDAILDRAVSQVEIEELGAAADQQFNTLLPPGEEDVVDKERWLLFDIGKKYLLQRKAREVVVEVAPPPPEEDDDEPIVFTSFKQLFDETLARHAKRSLKAVVVSANHATLRPHVPVPFALAPGFSTCYELLLRRHVLPDIRATRRIRDLAASRNWSDNGANRLIGIIQAGEKGNPILDTWDSRWAAYKSEGIGSKTRREDNPWDLFTEAALQGGFTPPTEADLPLLHAVIRWEAEPLINAWRVITLLYQQEFHPKNRAEQAREGALRDGIVRVIREQPRRAGDLLAIKAFFELPKCDRMFLRKLLQTISGTDSERRRVAPSLVDFYLHLPQ
jgi:hypothetical protein